jgi:hypothetical protein
MTSTVLLSVKKSDYFPLPADGTATPLLEMDGATLVMHAKGIEKFKVRLASPADPLEFDVVLTGLSEAEATRDGAPRVPITGTATLGSVAKGYARDKLMATVDVICFQIEPKTASVTSAPLPGPLPSGESPKLFPARFPRSFCWFSSCFPFACRFCWNQWRRQW